MSDTDTVYALIGYQRYYPRADNTLRVFEQEKTANRWMCLLKAAQEDAHFPVTFAELKQEFDWITGRSQHYEVVEHTVYANGYEAERDTDE